MVSLRLCLVFTLNFILFIHQTYSKNDRKSYIVYMGDHPKGVDSKSLPSLHVDMAQQVIGSAFEAEHIVHSYKESFNGFVVKLTYREAQTMAEMDNVVSVFPNTKNHLHTTKSWDFIGFPQTVKRTTIESDIVVGLLDSGIWPESESFTDKGFGPPPHHWKGSCHNFTCNNKIIGAKHFKIDGSYEEEDMISPRDSNGHGTHCASTVAGNPVDSVSLQGLGYGTARGGVPSARIAMYKVCWRDGCDDADILAAFDAAIADGVDIISISIGSSGLVHHKYFESAINIGSFHAMKRGILTSNSGNNLGPRLYTMTNYPPWLLSVAASFFGRKIVTKVQLGNGMIFQGISINTFDLKSKMFPLIYAGDVPNTAGGFNSSQSRYCSNNTLDKRSVKGKMVLCDGLLIPTDIGFLDGVSGVIFGANFPKDAPDTYALPAIFLTEGNLGQIRSYITSTSNPTATIFKSEEANDPTAPYIPSFSSRGPNPITPNILKPDIAAPGSEVIAAWSPISPISDVKGDKREVKYNVLSGTSMACPHVAAAAAYVKSFHPKWSPAMIKSALMTTATPMSPTLNPEAEFAYGAGHINPAKAIYPGLVYDISEADYVKFLCGEGYKDKTLRILTKDHTSCHKQANKSAVYDFNLPSVALFANESSTFRRVYHRTVTNVGSATSTYKARVVSPSLIDIQVKPNVLNFTCIGEKKPFSVTIEGTTNVEVASASLIWEDGNFLVRSPIVVHRLRVPDLVYIFF